ncbi:hypothetical protein KXV85_005014, partial [Aspergillus fumigatus]
DHQGDPLLRQSRSRRAQRGRREGRALDRRRARAWHCLRRRQLRHRRHLFLGLSVVGRTRDQAAPRSAAAGRLEQAPAALDLGASCPARELANQLGRQALLRRSRSGAVDRALPAFDGDRRPCASIALHPRRLVVRPAWRYLGIQCRPAAGTPAGLHRARHRRWQG